MLPLQILVMDDLEKKKGKKILKNKSQVFGSHKWKVVKSVSGGKKRNTRELLVGEGGGSMIPVLDMLIFRCLCDIQADVKETTEYDSPECKEAWAGR